MVERMQYEKERRTLSKLVGMQMAKKFRINGIDPVGVSKYASGFVEHLSDEEVLREIEKAKRTQNLVAIVNNRRSKNRISGELSSLSNKRFLEESKRVKRTGHL